MVLCESKGTSKLTKLSINIGKLEADKERKERVARGEKETN